MASEKQIEANRRNAQLSTGPRTDEGKTAVAQNACKHGIRAIAFHLEHQSEFFDDLFAELTVEFQPQTLSERIYVERMALVHEQLMYLERFKTTALFDRDNNAEKSYDHLALYWQAQERLERAFDQALQTLRKLQKERAAQEPAVSATLSSAPAEQPKEPAQPHDVKNAPVASPPRVAPPADSPTPAPPLERAS